MGLTVRNFVVGCRFRHETSEPAKLVNSEDAFNRMNADSPVFIPQSNEQPKVNVSAPEFVPRGSAVASQNNFTTTPMLDQSNQNNSVTEPTPDRSNQNEFMTTSNLDQASQHNLMTTPTLDHASQNNFITAPIPDRASQNHVAEFEKLSIDSNTENRVLDMYYQDVYQQQQPQYHLYAPQPPARYQLQPYQRSLYDFSMSDNLRENLQKKADAILHYMPNPQLPDVVDNFHSLNELNYDTSVCSKLFGYKTKLYKADSHNDGKTYMLVRLEGFRLLNEKSILGIEQFKPITNANIVGVYGAFTTKAFKDSSILFVYDFYPLSTSLMEFQQIHSKPQTHGLHNAVPMSEKRIWSFACQLASAIKSVHDLDLSIGCLDASTIFVSDQNRPLVNFCGIMEVIKMERSAGERLSMQNFQQYDLLTLSNVIINLSNAVPHAHLDLNAQLEYMNRRYSKVLVESLLYLTTSVATIGGFIRRASDQLIQVMDNSLLASDLLQKELTRELENGRLVRLVSKLGFINERAEFEYDPHWSETGDRYIIKLFRDYVFHQQDAAGKPVINMYHVVQTLNKLDAGSEETILLVSRDGQTSFIVSYSELKNSIEKAFNSLLK